MKVKEPQTMTGPASAFVLEEHKGIKVLDGSFGEGGGQIVRSTLALAAATGQAVRIVHLRKNRDPKGLRPQHLMAARSLAELCSAHTEGLEVGSSSLRFEPRKPVVSGTYTLQIGTAGSTSLLLHALFPALVLASGGSELTLSGGTHQTMAPTTGYLQEVWAPCARALGYEVDIQLVRAGFYPRGGGTVRAQFARGTAPNVPLSFVSRGPIERITARAGVARLPRHIAERMLAQVEKRLVGAGLPFSAKDDGTVVQVEALSPGAYVELLVQSQPLSAGFSGIGEKGVPAEQVADEAAGALIAYERAGEPVDPHLADQLAILLALVQPEGPAAIYRTSEVTLHLLTHAAVLSALWPVSVEVHGDLGSQGEVRVAKRVT